MRAYVFDLDEVSKDQWDETRKLADGAILDFKDAPLPE